MLSKMKAPPPEDDHSDSIQNGKARRSLRKPSLSVASTSKTNTSCSAKPTNQKLKGGQKKQSKVIKPSYKFSCYLKIRDGKPIFGVQFNHFLRKKGQPLIFASVGGNLITIFECPLQGGIKIVQCYGDPDPDEVFNTCAWSYEPETGRPVLAAAGIRGVIRIFNPTIQQCTKHYIGHPNAINELKFHPKQPYILLSASKDRSLKLWNIQSDVCIAIFGGVDGHRDEILSADFNRLGDKICSCGIDHSIKIWSLDKPAIQDAIENSYSFNPKKSKISFNTIRVHFPDFSTRNIHNNYVDCVHWFGRFILSKSCENCIICWKPGENLDSFELPNDSSTAIIHQFDYKESDIFFIRFGLNYFHTIMAVGNQTGKTFVWSLPGDDPALIRRTILKHPKCITPIRQTSFSSDGKVLICVSDDGTIWRWDENNADNNNE